MEKRYITREHNPIMETIITKHKERLPDGIYLATSDDVQGLVAQGRTVSETLEIARDVVKKLIEAQGKPLARIKRVKKSFDYPLVVGV